MKITKEIAEELSRKLVDKGFLIEAGFVGLQVVMSPDAPDIQVKEMRMAFFAGAQHLFSSILSILEPGAEATDKDLQRMNLISNELQKFEADFRKSHGIPSRGD